MPIDLFISYAHQDQALRDQLANHLSGLRNLGMISDWFDGDIIEGREWEPELFAHLKNAHIILLLISPDFIASKFCYHLEMKQALLRHETHEARVIPVILRPTDWTSLPFAKLQALPKYGKPVVHWPTHDDAFLDVVKGIKRAIRDLQNDSLPSKNTLVLDEPGAQGIPSSTQPMNEPQYLVDGGSTINTIHVVKGRAPVVIQGRTVHYYPTPRAVEGEHQTTPLSPSRTVTDTSETVAVKLELFVDEMHTALDARAWPAQAPGTADAAQIDTKLLTLFINMMLELKQGAVSISPALLGDTKRLCQRLNILCPLP